MKTTVEITLKSLSLSGIPEKALLISRNLLTVEMIWPKAGTPRKSATRQITMKKGKVDFNDYLNSLKQMRKMGGLSSVLGMLPGLGMKKDQLESLVDDKQLKRTEAIVLSMTPEERMNPKLLTPQRKYRIAKGSGNDIADVNRFIKQFNQMSKMMKQAGGAKKGKRRRGGNPFGGMNGMGGMGGRGGFPF